MAEPRHAAPQIAPRRRGLGMIRVSKKRDEMHSPEVQRHAIETWAASNNVDITDWVEGIDESGSRARSAWWPRLDQSIDRLERGEFDVIVVWKFSRTGRQRLRWAIALDRVDKLGGGLISATEPIDATRSHGKLARGMVGEFNAYQADLIGESWMEAHARRFRAGKPINGKPRFGYAYDRETGFTPDPITGLVLAETYRRYIAGESVYSLVAWLNAGVTRPVSGYGITKPANSADSISPGGQHLSLAEPTITALQPLLDERATGYLIQAPKRPGGPPPTRDDRARRDGARLRLKLMRFCETEGLPVVTPHGLRHTFVTLARDAGVPDRDLMASTGHVDPRMLTYYDRAHAAVDRNATHQLTQWLDLTPR